MSDAPTRPPEISRSVPAPARTLVATARRWALYLPEHPAILDSPDRLPAARASADNGQMSSFGVTPDTRIVAGVPVEERKAVTIGEAAQWKSI